MILDSALVELESLTTTKQACDSLGLARATVYQAKVPPVLGRRPLLAVGIQPNALSRAERAEILAVLNSDRFADNSPAQVWAVCLDEGVSLGSVSTYPRSTGCCGRTGRFGSAARRPPTRRRCVLSWSPMDRIRCGVGISRN